MPKIQLITTDGSKLEIELHEGSATFGRAEGNDFVIPDGSVSSRHGEFHVKGASIEIVDLGSTNGTHVDGQRVERANIAPGGTFKLGTVEGSLVAEAGAAEAHEEAPAEEHAESGPQSSWSGAPAAAAVISGLGATPCPVRQRKGFGPKVKEKDKTASLLMVFGVVSLLVCAGAAFLIFTKLAA